MASVKYKNNLELKLDRTQSSQTICQHQYTTYPLRLSSCFRLEGGHSNRAYVYLINTSPGLLAGDELNLSLQLPPNTSLYLTDQAATKVHPMPEKGAKASINYHILVDADASLELVPEPIILYQDSVLEQKTIIRLHPTAKLFSSEIILPGRLAKKEYYDFNYYFTRLQVGKQNKFKTNKLFTSLPIMGNALAVLPDTDLTSLIAKLEEIELADCKNLEIAVTILPSNNGILIRALSAKTFELKKYFTDALNCIRAITNQSPVPYIAK